MIVFLNGRFVPEEQAVVSVFDRSFLYGDGLFETLRLHNGTPFRWSQHLERLQRGAEALKIDLPFSPCDLRRFAARLLKENLMVEGMLRVTLSRGGGIRGYSTKGASSPFLVMSLHPAPALVPEPLPQWSLLTASVRLLANDPLSQFKTANKLPHIVARAQAEAAGADEALLLNSDGFVAQGAASNLFWIERNVLCTPPLASGALAGVTRALILEICQNLGLTHREAYLRPAHLIKADGLFLTLSSWGVIEAASLDSQPLNRSPLTDRLRQAYTSLVLRETGAN